ncbi:hypothetical protein [Halegenticoccus tardaugens]|uniref:hypothetical protein n=1 Tax=Halegenticoccus tardaugens TaxID=2071624 RepID=UPI00100ACE24|nr:hypothetical protein [Halegenticoccus tardaugens]
MVGNLGDICDDENDTVRNWRKYGNLDIHGWAFVRFTLMFEYKGEDVGLRPFGSLSDNLKTRSSYRMMNGNQCVDLGLYVWMTVKWLPPAMLTNPRISNEKYL